MVIQLKIANSNQQLLVPHIPEVSNIWSML